jgi:allophanate hydrolase subunit 2
MDAYRLAQARPGTKIVFEEIGLEEAIAIEKEHYSLF